MVITCPHCHASYRLSTTIRNAVLVCHRCGEEFRPDDQREETGEKAAAKPDTPSLFDWKRPDDDLPPPSDTSEFTPRYDTDSLDEADADIDEEIPHFLLKEHHLVKEGRSAAAKQPTQKTAPSTGEKPAEAAASADNAPEQQQPTPANDIQEPVSDTAQAAEEPVTEAAAEPAAQDEPDIAPPSRRKTSIWPWLVFILLLAAGAGLWFKQDVWLQNSWVRSTLINIGAPLPLQSSDWLIAPKSVHSQWLTRDDGSRILIIEGEVTNRLFSELPPPSIRVDLFDLPGALKPVTSKVLPITEPPSMTVLKKAPYKRPAQDRLPIAGEGTRGFLLVVEQLPTGIRDFALTALPPQ